MNKKIKCEECGEPIVSKDKVKYILTKRVCDACFYYLKRANGTIGRDKGTLASAYRRWLRGDKFYI